MKKKLMISMLALCMALSMFGCAAKSAGNSARVTKSHDSATSEVAETTAYEGYEDAYAGDLALAYGNSEAEDESVKSVAVSGADAAGSVDAVDTKTADAKKQMLIYRATVRIDSTDFEQTITELKAKINEYHGFLENETQSDGTDYYGRYVLDESDKDYTYTATIRIPSEYFDSFLSNCEGLGYLRSKTSSVDNVSTRYGTLKNELEIYEAEYDRYLKQYEETENEEVALSIQRELRNLAITISDIKTSMSSIESDVAYSYVTITIHSVTVEQAEEQIVADKREDNFKTRVSEAAKESWKNFLGFLEGVLIFFIETWWGLLIMGIIALVIVLIIRFNIKKAKKRAAKAAEEREKKEKERAEEIRKINEAKEREKKGLDEKAGAVKSGVKEDLKKDDIKDNDTKK